MPAEASRRLAAGAEPGDDPGITLAHGLPMRRLALLIGFCLLLAFSAGGQLLAGPPGMTTQAPSDPSAVATSSHAHAAHAHDDHGDHAHPPAPASDHGDHAHGHGDHAHGDHGRQAPQEWLERESPLSPSADTLAFGQQVYQRYCAACHGERGRGDGVAAGVAGFVPVPTDLAQHGAGHAAGEYAWLVKAGNPDSAMPRFAGKLGEEEAWAVVLYIRHVLAADAEGNGAGGHRH